MTGDAWLCAWRELTRRRARAAASTCGYALAVAVMIVVATALRFSREAADQVLTHTGTHFIAFVPASVPVSPGCAVKKPATAEEGFVANGVAAALFPVSLVERIKNLPTVKDASPYLLYRFRHPADGHTFTVGGFDANNTLAVGTTCCAATDIIGGQFLTPRDRGNVLAEEAYARLRNLHVGDRIRIANRSFSVIGIVNPGIRPAKADIYMPYGEAEEVIIAQIPLQPIHKEANAVLVEVSSAAVQDEAIRSVRALMSGLVVSSYACYKPASDVMGINERAAWLLAGILGVGVLLLAAKTEWTWVIERRRDIGILKAIGWSDGNVVAQILAESILQAAAGGILGTFGAILFLWITPARTVSGSATGGPIPMIPAIFLIALGLAVAGGLVAGIGPAMAAARQRPARALRGL